MCFLQFCNFQNLKLHVKNLRDFEKLFEIFDGLIKFHPSKISKNSSFFLIYEEKEGKRIALTYIPGECSWQVEV